MGCRCSEPPRCCFVIVAVVVDELYHNVVFSAYPFSVYLFPENFQIISIDVASWLLPLFLHLPCYAKIFPFSRYYHVKASGTPVQQYNPPTSYSWCCQRVCICLRHCHRTIIHPRAPTGPEVITMVMTLRAKAYAQLAGLFYRFLPVYVRSHRRRSEPPHSRGRLCSELLVLIWLIEVISTVNSEPSALIQIL